MKYDGALGAILLAVLIVLALATTFLITPLVISGTHPSTYLVIPLLMLPIFALFFAKERIRPQLGSREILAGILLFALLLLVTLSLRAVPAYLFLTYRLDFLIAPLLIAIFAILIFGLQNLRRFAPLMAYALLASPLVLSPILSSNASFAALNTQLVYGILSPFIPTLSYSSPITLLSGSYQIG